MVRDTPAAVAAMTAWRDAMAPGSTNKSAEGWWIDDQLALTQLLDGDSMPFQGMVYALAAQDWGPGMS